MHFYKKKCFKIICSTESEDSSDDEIKSILHKVPEKGEKNAVVPANPSTYSQLFPPMKSVYGVDVHPPSKSDLMLYKKYARMASSCYPNPNSKSSTTAKYLKLVQQSAFTIDNTLRVTTPYVARTSLDVYINYCHTNHKGAPRPSPTDISLYRRYASR